MLREIVDWGAFALCAGAVLLAAYAPQAFLTLIFRRKR